MASTDSTAMGTPARTTPTGGAAAAHVPAGPQVDARKAPGDRLRDAIWPEVHDAFDTCTAEVDDRAGGNPVGNPRNKPTGRRSLPE